MSCFNVQCCMVGVLESEKHKGEILFKEDVRLLLSGEDAIASCNRNEILNNRINQTFGPAATVTGKPRDSKKGRLDQSVSPRCTSARNSLLSVFSTNTKSKRTYSCTTRGLILGSDGSRMR